MAVTCPAPAFMNFLRHGRQSGTADIDPLTSVCRVLVCEVPMSQQLSPELAHGAYVTAEGLGGDLITQKTKHNFMVFQNINIIIFK